MKKVAFTLTLVSTLFITYAQTKDAIKQQSNDANKIAAEAAPDGWTKTASLGLNLDQLMLINPRLGDGLNRLGLGANGTITAKYKNGRLFWDNILSENFGIAKIGRGSVPFQKAIDELKGSTSLGYQTSANSKWYYTLEAGLRTQLTPSYAGGAGMGSLLRYDSYLSSGIADSTFEALPDSMQSLNRNNALQSKFMAPGNIYFAPGATYKHNDHFKLFISPAAVNLIVVNDDIIAARQSPIDPTRGLYGTEWRSATDFDKTALQLGALAIARYNNKWLNDKLNFLTDLSLYSNYLRNPQNIDVEWNTDLGYTLLKGLSLNLKTSLYYDDDQILLTDKDKNTTTGLNGYEYYSKNIRFVEGFFVRYGITF